MRYLVLGPLQVDAESPVQLGGYRQRLVLAVLLSRPNEDLATDWLIDAVWGDHPPRTARKTLQTYVTRLRGLLGADSIEGISRGYRMRVGDDQLDTLRFKALADAAHQAMASDAGAAAEQAREAMSLWRGLPFGDLADEPALQAESKRLQQRRIDVLEDRTSSDLALGHGRRLVGELAELVSEHPLREGLRANLMLALYRADRQADALAVFDEGRALLAGELGLDPSESLADLHQRMLRHDPELDAPSELTDEADWDTARNPYKGLRAFGPNDTEDFFGRSALVEEILERIRQQAFVAVVGASGSGKSSAVLAGVIPCLAREPVPWQVAGTTPGTDPWQAIVQALSDVTGADPDVASVGDDLDLLRLTQAGDGDQPLLLVIDQFEETLSDAVDSADRDRLLRNLVEAARDPSSRLTVVTTHRADLVHRLLTLFPDGPLLVDGLVPVLPLTPAELEAAAAQPAHRVGVRLEPELLAELVGDMTGQPGALPLFEYAMTEVFEHRTGQVLTRAGYRSLGGLRGALARRAEQTHDELDPKAQQACREVFLRLVLVHEDGSETRRRVPRSELDTLRDTAGRADEVLEAFGAARLLTFDWDEQSGQATVDLAHEALLGAWPRLRAWLDDAHDDVRLHSALTVEVAGWEASGRDDDYLITGSRLARYDDWPEQGGVKPSEIEQTYLSLSRQRRDEQQSAERRTSRRLRRLVAVVSLLAVVGAVLAGVAINRAQATAASERESHARELANAATTVVDDDPELAMLLALEAIDVTREDGYVIREAESALHAGVNGHRYLASTAGATHVAFHPDGSLLVGGPATRLVDPTNGAETLALDGSLKRSVAVSQDGSLMITGSDNNSVILWDGSTGEPVRTLSSPAAAPFIYIVAAVAISPDGSRAAALLPWGEGIVVWDTSTGDRIASSSDPTSWPPDTCCYPVSLQFSPDGSQIAANWYDHARVMDASTGEWLFSLHEHTSVVTDVDFAPDGSTLLTASMDGTIRLWSTETGQGEALFDADSGQLTSLAVSPDGERLLTGNDAGQVTLWSLRGQSLARIVDLPGAAWWVYDLAISADGAVGAGVGGNDRVVTWDISPTGPGEIAAWQAPGAVSFSNDGSHLLTTDSETDEPVIVRTSDWQPARTLTGALPDLGDTSDLPYDTEQGRILGAAWSPDDTMLATVVGNYTVHDDSVVLWDTATGESLRSFTSPHALRGSVAFSGDGHRVAAATCDDGVPIASVWDVGSGRLVVEGPGGVCGTAVDLDGTGQRLSVQTIGTEGDPAVVVLGLDDGEQQLAVSHHSTWRGAAVFSPDDTRLLTAGRNGFARIWDTTTGDLLVSMEGHDGAVEHAIWSADGRTVVTSGHDGTARLWDAETGEMGVVLSGHDGWPDISISPDGQRLATGDGSVRIWTLDVDELIEIAQYRLTRSLTPAECSTYHVEHCA